MSWWRVKPPIDSEFLVLVVGGRVVVSTKDCEFFGVGDKWKEVRRMLTGAQFESRMEMP